MLVGCAPRKPPTRWSLDPSRNMLNLHLCVAPRHRRWDGAMANAAANFVGSYPWFLTFNLLDAMLSQPERKRFAARILRSAFLGCCATAVSDTCSNSIRVIKTTKQTSATTLTYVDALQLVVSTDGWTGLLFRGLGTRLLANALQSALFSVVWKAVEVNLVPARR
eukprot:scaffold134292_cov35-Tisochrysis_lutea.AAC.2